MDPICPTSQLPHLAICVPVIRDKWIVGKLATARWARYALEIAGATQSALHVFSVSIASQFAHLTCRVPIVSNIQWIVYEIACANFCASLGTACFSRCQHRR